MTSFSLQFTITEHQTPSTWSGSGWAWILPLSDGVSTVPRQLVQIQTVNLEDFCFSRLCIWIMVIIDINSLITIKSGDGIIHTRANTIAAYALFNKIGSNGLGQSNNSCFRSAVDTTVYNSCTEETYVSQTQPQLSELRGLHWTCTYFDDLLFLNLNFKRCKTWGIIYYLLCLMPLMTC